MSAPNEQAKKAVPLSAGRLLPDGRRVYRLTGPQVVWWAWVALAVFALGDLVIQGHSYLSLKFALGLLTVTGLVYACTLWPRVIADDSGVTVQNPFRRFTIPWAAVRGIFLADSVEIQCARAPKRSVQKKDKTVYSWALSSARRGRARARLHGWQWDQGKRNRPSNYGQLPGQAKELVKMTQTEVMAREMAKLSEEARAGTGAGQDDGRLGEAGLGDARFSDAGLASPNLNGASKNGSGSGTAVDPDAAGIGAAGTGPAAGDGNGYGQVVTATWSWPALAAFLVPGIAFAITMLVG
ncbi:MAG TPA: PH domain-containing protein [Streptosporangiaceae bacterium]|nr:PH domain-containing protein [Streptosporangiaceae bacterium]